MSAENFIFVDFSAGKVDGSDCQPRNMCYSENILSLDSKPNRKLLFDENKEKFPNPWLVYTLKHLGVMRQISTGLTSLPSTLKSENSTKI